MAGLSSPGVGSGLDINGLVKRLMEVERAPLAKLAKQEADFQAKITAFGTLKGGVSAFQTAVRSLASETRFNTAKATAADATVLSATASSIAKPGSYSIEVNQLAQQHRLASATFADPAIAIGTGTLTIDFGTHESGPNSFTVNGARAATSISIHGGNNSLTGIRDAINQARAGVSASIVNDGSGFRLALSSNDAGRANSLRILVSNDGDGQNTDQTGLSRLAYNPVAAVGAGRNIDQTMAAQNAEFRVNGIAISKPTNLVGDAITGVTLNLLKTSPPTTLSIARDTAGVKTAVEDFVKAYNDLAASMRELGGYDFATQKGGLLQGDSTLRGLQSQIRGMLSQRLEFAGGGLSSLSDIGVSFQRDGTLAINGARLDAVLADPEKNVASLFATMGVPSDGLIRFAASNANTQPGRYGIDITQIATRGTATGSMALADDTVRTTITSSNQLLDVRLNGIAATITLNQGSFTRTELVAELQARINSHSLLQARGHTVSASHENGILRISSTLFGAESRMHILGGSAAATLFGSTMSVDGVDVAGTIGGQPATGRGQMLTGTGAASGLQLLVEGGGTGARGTIGFATGLAAQMNQTLTRLLGEDGQIASRTEGIENSISGIDSRRQILERRLEQIEQRYRDKFNTLDRMVASMQQTSQYLTQQLANLPNTSQNR